MNEAERRFAELLISEDKYSRKDLHKIKNVLCFLRDCTIPEDSVKAEKFLAEFIRRKENSIVFDTTELELEFGIEN